MQKFSVLCFIVLFFTFITITKGSNNLSDSTKTLSFEDFLQLVMVNHPLAKQAQLLTDRAKQEVRMSRGVFDPSISSKYYRKEFEGKNYYTLWENYLTIPTWFGTSFKTGYDKDSGINLNGDDLMPSEGLSYVGISVSVLQGLVIDERRATLRQAQLFPRLAEAEKVKVLNKLLLQAAKEYWEWQLNYKMFKQYNVGYTFAFTRFEGTVERAKQGDLSMIDTVEASLQVQSMEVLKTQAALGYRNASLSLSNYLWNADKTPLEINNSIVPDTSDTMASTIATGDLDTLIQFAIFNHPNVVKLQVKLQQLTIERRLSLNKMLPKLNVDYGLLQRGFYTNQQNGGVNYAMQNYKLGVGFSTPLFLRGERSKYQLTKIKILENNYDLQQTNREIRNDMLMVYNESLALGNLIAIQQRVVNNAELLRQAEQIKFENGESSVFLVNSRDMYLLNSQIKLFELQTKFQKNRNTLTWSAGQMLK